MDKPFELLEENISDVFGIIQKGVNTEKISQIDQMLQGMKQNIDSTLSIQIATLAKIGICPENLNSIREEADLKLDEKLSFRQEIAKYEFSGRDSSDPTLDICPTEKNIIIKGNEVKIIYPFNAFIDKDLDIIQEFRQDVSALQFKISGSVKHIGKEDISRLCYIRTKLSKIQDVSIDIGSYAIDDELLLDIFSCLFWKNGILSNISLLSHFDGSYEKSIFFLAQNVLPPARNLQTFSIHFDQCTVTSLTFSVLSQSLSLIAENLTSFHFILGSKIDRSALFRMHFGRMPNLKYFAFQAPLECGDAALKQLSFLTLPSLKKLKSFYLFLGKSKVTDKGVKELFDSFPPEWFESLERLQVGLSNINVTDSSLRKFINESLRQFKNLKSFAIYNSGSQLTPKAQAALEIWRCQIRGQDEPIIQQFSDFFSSFDQRSPEGWRKNMRLVGLDTPKVQNELGLFETIAQDLVKKPILKNYDPVDLKEYQG